MWLPSKFAMQRVGRRPVAGSFDDPSDFGADLVAWYKADAGVYNDAGSTLATDGQTVRQWNDQSGNGYHVGNTGTQPVYDTTGFNSSHGIVFSANNTLLATSATAVNFGGSSPNFSVFIVVNPGATQSVNAPFVSFDEGSGADWNDTTSIRALSDASSAGATFGAWWNSSARVTSSISTGTNYRLGCVFNGTALTLYNNNVSAGTPETLAIALSQNQTLKLMNDAANAGTHFGTLAEIVITKHAMTLTDRNNLDGYFTTKWGL